MAEAATVLDPPTTLRPGSQSGPREKLVEEHRQLVRLQALSAKLAQERAQAAKIVERRKVERSTAQAHVDAEQAKAMAAKASSRPVALIDAQRLLGDATSELDFAEGVLTKADEAVRSNEFAISEASKATRAATRAVAVAAAEDMAITLRDMRDRFVRERTAFRALIRALSGQGARFGPVAVDMFRSEVPQNEAVVNSPEHRREHELARQWHAWVEAALNDPDAPLPKED
jgi:hypothetical protein